MNFEPIYALFGILLGAQLAQGAVIFWRLGKLERKVMCPWGQCPSYEKAKDDLAGR